MIRLIDPVLLDAVSAAARLSPRRRKNRNFHPADDYPAHRLLNAIEPGSYVAPHRHLDPDKDETIIALRGRLGLVIFDAAGSVAKTAVLTPGDGAMGVDIPHGSWHTVLALVSGTVFFEAKAGPYQALSPEERASWAPQEDDDGAGSYLARLEQLFRPAGPGS